MVNVASLLVICLFGLTSCENILIIQSVASTSHIYTIRSLAHALAAVGHKITIIRTMEITPRKTLHTTHIEEYTMFVNNSKGRFPFFTPEENGRFEIDREHVWKNGLSINMFPPSGLVMINAYCHGLFGNDEIMAKINAKKYSVAIVDLLFNDCGLAVANSLDVPIIGFWAFCFSSGPAIFTSGFNLPSSIPQTFSYLSENMSFRERIANTFVCFVSQLLVKVQIYTSYYVIQQYLPNSLHPQDIYKELSGMLIDSHPGIDIPQVLPLSFAKIGGTHMEKPKALPRNIMEFIYDAEDCGVILFSLGSMIDAHQIPSNVMDAYFNAFARLDQNVIVKSEGIPKYVPDNVMVIPYIPQLDILANNKTVLFISHGGMKGIIESIYYSVPMVGIPIFLDQKDNLIRLKDLGVSTLLDKESSAEVIYNNIQQVLQNPSYKETAVRLSANMKAHPDPKKIAVDLVQLVIRTNGATHLKMASRNLNIFQYLCLDIIAFLILLLIGLITVMYYALELKLFQKALHYMTSSEKINTNQKKL